MSRDYRIGASLSTPRKPGSFRESLPQYEVHDDLIPMECNMKITCQADRGNPPEMNDLNYRQNADIGMKSTRVQAMKSKLDDLEPRINCVGDKMQKIADDMQKFRELLMARRREIEELERAVNDRLTKAEQKLQNSTRELTDYKQDAATENAGLRQTVTTLCSEVACLRTWVLENLRQMNTKLEMREREYQNFKNYATDRLKGHEREFSARGTIVHDLRSDVEAKFAALKEALCGPGCSPRREGGSETITDALITTMQGNDDDFDRLGSFRGSNSKRPGTNPDGMSPLFDQRNSDGHPQRFGTNDPAQRKSTQLSTDTNGAAENMVTKVVSNAENALDQMKRDTIRMGQLGN